MISINILPEDVLLAIFDFLVLVDNCQLKKKEIEAWQSLVHVCRRWRCVIFGSPRHLKLQLVCTPGTPARDTLDVWPDLPLFIRDFGNHERKGVDNVIAVLERSNRVCQINLKDLPRSHLEKVSAAMRAPFPALSHLELSSELSSFDEMAPVLPDSFLGKSAPRLRLLWLDRIPFPGLPKLLLSATHIVVLYLGDIPHSGYIAPEAMATALSTLASLGSLSLEFRSPRSHPDREKRRPPPRTRSVLPVLTYFWFKGVTEYLDDLVALIDTPQINCLYITFFNQIIFDTPQLAQFLSRTPNLKAPEQARIAFEVGAATISLSSQTSSYVVRIPCRELDWQVSSLEQVCTWCLPPISTLADLYIYEKTYSQPDWQDNVENTLWLELLHPFATAKNLYISDEFAPRVVPALKELVGRRTTDVLPSLQNIFLEGLQPWGPVQEGIARFVVARLLSGLTVAVSRWDGF